MPPGLKLYDLVTNIGVDLRNLVGRVGDLAGLNTVDKSSVVAAINESLTTSLPDIIDAGGV